jgi:phosphate transport system protein
MEHFLREPDRLTADLLELAGAVETSVRDALRALDERRPDLARRVIDGDTAIDREEVRIEEQCIRILVLSTPVAGDLRRVIAVLKIDNDLERIADLAVNIAEEALAAGPEDLPMPRTLGTMADRAVQMMRDSLNAFVGSDVALARTVLAMDDEVDRLEGAIRDEAKALVRADPGRADAAFRLFSVARQLERIADHATNIAEDLVSLREGVVIRHRTEDEAGPSRADTSLASTGGSDEHHE